MFTDKNSEFNSQTPNTTSANYSAGYGQTLMADTASGSSTGSSNQSGGSDAQMTDPDNDRTPVWQMAGKALIVLLVIFGLVLGGRWAWSNYSSDDSDAAQTEETAVVEQEPLPINDSVADDQLSSEPIEVDGDIPALGPADPIVMTVGAAILAATLYRFSNLAHQPNRR